jgi:hypothetical protein
MLEALKVGLAEKASQERVVEDLRALGSQEMTRDSW